jgi:hypothetical protein
MILVRALVGLGVPLLLTATMACGGSSPAAPSTPAAPPAPTTFSLSGQVTSTAGGPISGATVRIGDGPNANRSTISDASGNYSLGALTSSGFTVFVSASNYGPQSLPVSLTTNQTMNVALTPLFANMVGAWNGTILSAGLGTSTSCSLSWLVTSQTGGDFSGSYQLTGGNGCSEAGSLAGTISTTNTVTALRGTAAVTNGAICTDSNVSLNGLVSGRNITIQRTFTRSCTSPSITFSESQTYSLAKQ